MASSSGAVSVPITVDPRPAKGVITPLTDNGTVRIPFTVDGTGPITDLDVRIDQLYHSWLSDLTISIEHDGRSVLLIDRLGGSGFSGDDIKSMVFDSDAASVVAPQASGPLQGRARPVGSLDAFDGLSTDGAWALVVTDAVAEDGGYLQTFGVESPQQSCGRVEIPVATTGDASPVAHDSATVAGTVDPNGRATGMRIAYGTTESYGSVSGVADAGAGIGAQPFAAVLPGLSPSTTYHYRVEALREGGVVAVAGGDRTFTTGPAPVASSITSPPAITNANTGKVGALGGADKVAPKFLGAVVPVILPTVKGKAKVSFGFKLSEAATVKVTIAKSTVGVKVGKRCLAKKPGRSGKACVLLTPAGTTSKALKSGGSTLAVGSLKPGAYVATIVATDAAKNASKPITVKFTVKPAPKPKPKR